MSFKVIVPAYNPGKIWVSIIQSIKSQSVVPDDVLIIDSGSKDSSLSESLNAGFNVESIDKGLFDHGGTRNLAAQMEPDVDFIIFMTQDALLLNPFSFERILAPFEDEKVAAVCGRQLPRKQAAPIEVHARIYNYPEESFIRSSHDISRYGLKTAFLSNSFAAYRSSALVEVGGFPSNVIFGEDMYVASKLLGAGYQIAYAADACVYHSHGYSLLHEMRRYFDMGVFHTDEPWIREMLGGAESEGFKFLASEYKYLLRHAFWRVPESLVRTVLRYVGFRLGLMHERLPMWLKRRLAMNKGYFQVNREKM